MRSRGRGGHEELGGSVPLSQAEGRRRAKWVLMKRHAREREPVRALREHGQHDKQSRRKGPLNRSRRLGSRCQRFCAAEAGPRPPSQTLGFVAVRGPC